MAIESQDLVDRVASHAKATGLFDRVNKHEPKNKPGRGLTCAIWVDRIEAARGRAGLASTTARVVLNCRIYTNMLQNPQDAIDPNVMRATDVMFEALSGDFSLGSEERWIDLLGATQGHPLFSQSGYINIDTMTYRVMTITVPIIVEDAWTQAA
jgi:hypothetical protein